MYGETWPVSPDFYLVGIAAAAVFPLYILGQIHQYRAGPSGRGDMERLFDDFPQTLPRPDGYRVFTDASGDARDVDLLEGIVADQAGGNLAGKTDERNAVVIGRCDACH